VLHQLWHKGGYMLNIYSPQNFSVLPHDVMM
jgi:hypothetical protein